MQKQLKKLDNVQKLFFNLLMNSSKKARGRRYSLHEKAIAVVLFKQSPRCYRFLQKTLGLPGETTLKQFQNEMRMETGNVLFFTYLFLHLLVINIL